VQALAKPAEIAQVVSHAVTADLCDPPAVDVDHYVDNGVGLFGIGGPTVHEISCYCLDIASHHGRMPSGSFSQLDSHA
jgi:hypothetical protein